MSELTIRRISVRSSTCELSRVLSIFLAFSCLGCVGPKKPFENPLTHQQVRDLTISKVVFIEQAGRFNRCAIARDMGVEEAIRHRIIQRIGSKYNELSGRSVLYLKIDRCQCGFGTYSVAPVILRLDGFLRSGNRKYEYITGDTEVPNTIVTDDGKTYTVDRLRVAMEISTDSLVSEILHDNNQK